VIKWQQKAKSLCPSPIKKHKIKCKPYSQLYNIIYTKMIYKEEKDEKKSRKGQWWCPREYNMMDIHKQWEDEQ